LIKRLQKGEEMVKETLLATAIAMYPINTDNVTIHDFIKISQNSPNINIYGDLNQNIISQVEKQTKELLKKQLKHTANQVQTIKEIFDIALIESTENLYDTIKVVYNNNLKALKLLKQSLKSFQKKPSIKSNKEIMKNLNNTIFLLEEKDKLFTKYYQEAKEAKATYDFMQEYIPKNREVLKALA
jgi:hypothetical protein